MTVEEEADSDAESSCTSGSELVPSGFRPSISSRQTSPECRPPGAEPGGLLPHHPLWAAGLMPRLGLAAPLPLDVAAGEGTSSGHPSRPQGAAVQAGQAGQAPQAALLTPAAPAPPLTPLAPSTPVAHALLPPRPPLGPPRLPPGVPSERTPPPPNSPRAKILLATEPQSYSSLPRVVLSTTPLCPRASGMEAGSREPRPKAAPGLPTLLEARGGSHLFVSRPGVFCRPLQQNERDQELEQLPELVPKPLKVRLDGSGTWEDLALDPQLPAKKRLPSWSL